jgi:hypothetical protein
MPRVGANPDGAALVAMARPPRRSPPPCPTATARTVRPRHPLVRLDRNAR